MATGIQKLLFVDTNIWLDFYRARSDVLVSLIGPLEEVADKIIVTHQLETEYKTNRQKAILEGIDVLKSPQRIPSVGVLANAKAFEMLSKDIKSAGDRVKKLEAKLARFLSDPAQYDPVYQACQRIFHKEDPLCLTRRLEDDEKRKAIRERAYRRFLHGCPPRKPNDTSMGDAINWEWIVECAKTLNGSIVIVSRDRDYGVTYNKVSYINDHLRQEFSNRVSQTRELLLYSKLSDALKQFTTKVTQEQEKAEAELVAVKRAADTGAFEGIETEFFQAPVEDDWPDTHQ
jgi:predicted nucleic acid-binding protein